MYLKNANIIVISGRLTKQLTEIRYDPLSKNYQENMKGSNISFYYINILFYSFHQVTLNHVGSYIKCTGEKKSIE